MDTSKLSKAQLKKMQDQNLDALKTFQGRKVEGMNLSQRVWKYVGQYREQLEAAIDAGLGEGRSAAQLSRDVRQNLRDPNRLFRRVRDKRGNLCVVQGGKGFPPRTRRLPVKRKECRKTYAVRNKYGLSRKRLLCVGRNLISLLVLRSSGQITNRYVTVIYARS